MKRFYIYLPVMLLCAILLTGCTKTDDNTESKEESNKQERVEEEKEHEKDLGYIFNPENFTKEKKTIGEKSDIEYTIDAIGEKQEEGYHLFTFSLSTTSQDPVLPFVSVDPVLDRGIYRVTLNGIVSDKGGIEYQQSKLVNKGAITGISKAVTSISKVSIYEIGFLANNPFTLESSETGSSSWDITVKVAYDTKYSAPTMDLGSTEFSSNEQKITGMGIQDGVKISSYSYSVSGGILKFVFSTASGTSNPIPSVEAKYDDMNILEVKFPSLSSDKVSTWGNTITLPSGIVVNVSRVGETSMYRFGGIGGAKVFKLSATQSPNQVIVEINLR